MLRRSNFFQACIALFTLGSSTATACEIPEATTRAAPIVMRKPVLGREVFFAAGYGVRRHPILGHKRMHTGVDWVAPLGSTVVAAGPGEVISAEPDGAYGNRVIVDHGQSWETLYAQLDTFAVRVGECVCTGTPLGTVGTTGLSSRPHLHFEVLKAGAPLDPMRVAIKASGASP